MNNKNCYCVIMAGGAGTRFWPVSRIAKPKQFLDVAETGKTFIRHTYDRMMKVIPQENILVVTASRYRDLVMEQIPELESRNLLLEPYTRNTAPSAAGYEYLCSLFKFGKLVINIIDIGLGEDKSFCSFKIFVC